MAVLTWLLVEGGCGTSQPKLVDAASQVESVRRGEIEAAEVGAERGRAEEETAAERERRVRRESGLVGIPWRWTRFVDPRTGGIEVPAPERYTVEFYEDAGARIVADCNRGRATYLIDRNELAVRIIALSDRPCGPDSLSREFVGRLGAASRFAFVDGQLSIALHGDLGSLELAPAFQRQNGAPDVE